jgi:ABC-type multidrug transport system fused ATPase/permease subunit
MLVGKADPQVIISTLAAILIAHFIIDAFDNFAFRHALVISRTLQRKLVSNIEIDLAHKNASLPIITIEDSTFKDKYALVKREVGFRLYPLVDQSVSVIAGLLAFVFTAGIIAKLGVIYLVILVILQIPRLLLLRPALNKINLRASTSARLSRPWDIYISFLESIKGSYETRILGIKDYIKKKLLDLQVATVGLFEQIETELLIPRTVTAVIPMTGVFTISFMSAKKVVEGVFSIGDWQLMVNAAYRLSDQLKETIDNIGNLSEAYIFVQQMVEVLNKENDSDEGKECDFSEIEKLEFDNVSFKYPNVNRYALKDVSFTINKAENVAIVGHNGAGKTTLVKLLCRFYEPTEGSIKINGIDIREFNIHSYWKLLSALFQDFESYGMSAAESIGYGNIEKIHDTARLEKVAKITGIHDYLNTLPIGYKTPLIRDLENGVGLSTGQWQKVAIARSLFRKSKIILLDEPTSNLDPESEEEIFNKLIRTVKLRIMFLISHRFSTVKRADRILVIESGKLAEQGTHKELMKANGLYAKLFRIQSESYKE